MTSRQKKAVTLAIILAIAMLAIPPTGKPITYGRLADPSYAPLWAMERGSVIDMWRLAIQLSVLCTAVFLFAFYEKKA